MEKVFSPEIIPRVGILTNGNRHAGLSAHPPMRRVGPRLAPAIMLVDEIEPEESPGARRNLERVHEICRKQHESGSRDFSRATIGRLCEAENVFKDGRVLYNAQSSDYVAIIESWAAYAGPPAPKPPKALASHDYLTRIEDPALRFIMRSIISERDKLQAQLNTLKSHSYTTVNRRPLGPTVTSSPLTGPVFVLEKHARLTPSERDALRKAISSKFLSDEGWREGSHGEILNHADRTLFDVGFASAIRKVLADSK